MVRRALVSIALLGGTIAAVLFACDALADRTDVVKSNKVKLNGLFVTFKSGADSFVVCGQSEYADGAPTGEKCDAVDAGFPLTKADLKALWSASEGL